MLGPTEVLIPMATLVAQEAPIAGAQEVAIKVRIPNQAIIVTPETGEISEPKTGTSIEQITRINIQEATTKNLSMREKMKTIPGNKATGTKKSLVILKPTKARGTSIQKEETVKTSRMRASLVCQEARQNSLGLPVPTFSKPLIQE